MEAKAVAKFVRISPRKARQVVDLIRGKKCWRSICDFEIYTSQRVLH